MNKERYHANKTRVYEIYGISEQDSRYNTHHQIFKRDVKKNPLFKGFDLDAKANLIPMPKPEHTELHAKVDKMEHYNTTKKKKKKRRRR